MEKSIKIILYGVITYFLSIFLPYVLIPMIWDPRGKAGLIPYFTIGLVVFFTAINFIKEIKHNPISTATKSACLFVFGLALGWLGLFLIQSILVK